MTISLGVIIPSMAQNIPSYVPKNGLVGWWPFNGNANDESGNGNNGTVNGATLSADRDGKANSAYSFDGIDDFINFISNNMFMITSDITISCWAKPKISNSIQKQLVWFGDNQNATDPYSIAISSSNKIYFRRDVASGYTNIYATSNSNIVEQFIHILGRFNSTTNTMDIFLNGIKEQSVVLNNTINYQTQKMYLNFGAVDNGTGQFYQGELDDIGIYNRALSDQEVKQLYQGCSKETATSSNFSNIILSNSSPIKLTAIPSGGTFSGKGVSNNMFTPSQSNIGMQTIKYNFINSSSCKDSTIFNPIVYDTVGNICKVTKYDTVTITNNVTKYDTILKLKFKLTTGINSNQMTSMTLYPNPTTDVLHIEVEDAKAFNGYRYRILDAIGKEVYNELVKATKTEIPLKSLGAAGMYLFEVIDQKNKTIQSKKIVLE